MPPDDPVDRVLTEFAEWCAAKHGNAVTAAHILGATKQQVYDWTSKRKKPSIAMFLRIQEFVKTHRTSKTAKPKP
jgi:hypothetical protein